MTLTGLLFSLLTGLCVAVFESLRKKAVQGNPALPVLFGLLAAHLPFLALWCGLDGAFALPPSSYFPPALASLAAVLMAQLLFTRAMQLSPISLLIPILSLVPVFAALMAIPLLGEIPDFIQWVGIFVIVAGVLAVYAPEDQPLAFHKVLAGFRGEAGAPIMLLAAFVIAATVPFDKIALRSAPASLHALLQISGMVLVLMLYLISRGQFRRQGLPSQSVWLYVIAALFDTGFYIFQLQAIQMIPVGLFEAIKRGSLQLATIALGFFLFREAVTRPKLIGVAIITIGLGILAFHPV
jgi:drug/metabolite transporter (DMT)-like permease